jgi:hypothetical protein
MKWRETGVFGGVAKNYLGELLRHILPVRPRRAGLKNDAEVTSTLPRYELERIAVPTLVMSVADDLFGTFDSEPPEGNRRRDRRLPEIARARVLCQI